MSEANKYHFPGYPGGKQPKKPKEHIYKAISIEVIQTVLQIKAKKYHAVYQSTWIEPKSNFNLTKMQ